MRRYAALVLALAAVGTTARAASLIDTFDDWSAFTEDTAGETVCYIGSAPKKERGQYKRRGDTYVLVTHRPTEKTLDVVSFEAGYTYKTVSRATVAIGTKSFPLFTDGGTAWADDDATDRALVQAMKQGLSMVLEGTSSRGTLTTDTYSLKGFTSAYAAAGKACGVS